LVEDDLLVAVVEFVRAALICAFVGDVAHYAKADVVSLLVIVCNGLADRVTLRDMREYDVFDLGPEPLYLGAVHHFGNLGKELVQIHNQLFPADLACQIVGENGVRIVGQKDVCLREEERK